MTGIDVIEPVISGYTQKKWEEEELNTGQEERRVGERRVT